MRRYVILTHDHPFMHWDLMLEAGDVLRTWRLSRPPEDQNMVTAEPLGDHRRVYLDYEGPVSGNRGSVHRWDAGDFEWLIDTADELLISVQGSRLNGRLRLWRGEAGFVCSYERDVQG